MVMVNSPFLLVLNGWMFWPPTCRVPGKSRTWFCDGDSMPPQAERMPTKLRRQNVATHARRDMTGLSHTYAPSGSRSAPGSGREGPWAVILRRMVTLRLRLSLVLAATALIGASSWAAAEVKRV